MIFPRGYNDLPEEVMFQGTISEKQTKRPKGNNHLPICPELSSTQVLSHSNLYATQRGHSFNDFLALIRNLRIFIESSQEFKGKLNLTACFTTNTFCLGLFRSHDANLEY